MISVFSEGNTENSNPLFNIRRTMVEPMVALISTFARVDGPLLDMPIPSSSLLMEAGTIAWVQDERFTFYVDGVADLKFWIRKKATGW